MHQLFFWGLVRLYNANRAIIRELGRNAHEFPPARVVKLVDTTDLKSVAWIKPAYRFDSGSGHQTW